MTTTRSNKLPTNLKERIAALEQRNTVNSTSSPTSPATSPGLTDANGAQSGKLKDRIAKFERKGGIPVPRGSFGLGAPPTGEGIKRQGEFYGNRVQAPKLVPHYTGGSIGSFASSPPRRSFSTSILNGDFDDNCPPISSPSSIGTPGSPEFNSFSPEASPSPFTNGDLPPIKRHATGTSFHAALEFARKVEAAKRGVSKPPTKKKSTDSANTEKSMESFATIPMIPLNETEDPTAAISVSSGAHESPSTIPGELPLQASGLEDSFVEPSASEVAECQSPVVALEESLVDKPRKRNLSRAKSTTAVSVNQATSKVNSVEGLSTPSNIENGTPTGATPIADVSSPAISGPTQFSFSQPPSLELHPSGERERKESTPIKTPRNAADDAQSTPILAEVAGDRKDLSLVTEAAPNDVDTTTSKNSTEASAPAAKTIEELPPRSRSQIPARRARPTIQPPDPPSFSLPPTSGFPSATASSASLSSANSLPSITEMSPSEVSRALKLTTSTGRGIPVFLPPSNSHTTRKSDFIYLPSSPEERPNLGVGLDVEESGIVGQGHSKAASEPDPISKTFMTVVHGKVKETPASTMLPTKRQVTPRTPMKNPKRASILQNALSPGHGELAALLQEAMLLEDTLNKGELPGESPVDETEDEALKAEADANSKALEAAMLKEEEEERQRAAQAVSRSKRDMSAHGRLKHTFLMPLSRAMSSQKQETSTPAEQPAPRSSRDEPRPKSRIFDHVVDKEVVQEKSPSPSKIPKLPGFKRFGSISRTVSQQDALLRYSSTSSEMSSEDSNFIVTPPDNAMEFGERKTTKDTDQQSTHSTLSFSFPSLSPKRAASFAEKIWSRARTSSNGSILSSASGVTPRSTEESTPQLQLPHIPSLSSFVPPVSEKGPALHRPASGSSLKNRIDTSGISKAPSVLATSTTRGQTLEDSHLVPGISTPNQPLSAVSMSSFGSLPSPLFDKAICDAFPSVPTGTPAQLRNSYLFRGRNPATGPPADFDSALLSSAIHLAARNKATATSEYTVPTSAQ